MEAQSTGVAEAPPPAAPRAWHALAQETVLAELSSSRAGLTGEVAARRLAEHGPNELRQAEPIRPLVLLLAQFKSLIVWILVAAALVSGVLSEWADCIAILSIVVANGLIGFYQEYNAARSLTALRRMTAPRARVQHDEHSLSIPATEVVPGDVLELEAGDLVPADARVLEAAALKKMRKSIEAEQA